MKNSIIEQESDDGFTQTSDEYKRGSRKGDPRMNAAVHVKHVDPSISLLDALLIGGFKFPAYDSSKGSKKGIEKVNEQEIFDENGITMQQRKNQ